MNENDLSDMLKAIAHPVRLRILRALAGAERNVGQIDNAANVGQPALSQQLAVLRKAGIVATRKDAKLVFYRIEEDRILAVSKDLAALIAGGEGESAPKRRAVPDAANFARLG